MQKFAVAAIAAAFAAFIYFAFISPSFYLFPDALYYDAVADAFAKTGKLFDPSTSPPRAVYTPQNGIVLVEAAAKFLAPQSHRLIVASLCLLAFCCSGFFAWRILQKLGLAPTTARLATAAFLCSPLLLRVAGAPLNDIFFIAMFLGAIAALGEAEPTKRISIMAALALFMGLFRLQGVVLFCAAAIGTYRTSRREALVYMLLAVLNVSVPFFIERLLSDDSSHTQQIAADILTFNLLLNNLFYMLGGALPKLLTAAGAGIDNFLLLLFPIGVAVYILVARQTWLLIAQNSRFAAIVAAATFGTMLFVVITPYYDPRYYLCVYPFILTVPLLALWATTRIRDIILIAACAANLLGLGGRLLFAEIDFSRNAATITASRHIASAATKLFSENNYLGYLVFERPTAAEIGQPRGTSEIILFGTETWRAAIAAKLRDEYEPVRLASPPSLTVRFTPKPEFHAMTVLRAKNRSN